MEPGSLSAASEGAVADEAVDAESLSVQSAELVVRVVATKSGRGREEAGTWVGVVLVRKADDVQNVADHRVVALRQPGSASVEARAMEQSLP
jgi:hypothetical protein